jgi:hypothetical protein
MANNYQEGSCFLEIREQDLDRARQIVADLRPEAARMLLSRYGEDESSLEDYLDGGCDLEFVHDGLWMHESESFDPEVVELFVRRLVDELEIDKPFFCSWASTCSKPRIDEFGGGAMGIVRGHPTVWCNASQWVQDALEQLAGQKSDDR